VATSIRALAEPHADLVDDALRFPRKSTDVGDLEEDDRIDGGPPDRWSRQGRRSTQPALTCDAAQCEGERERECESEGQRESKLASLPQRSRT